MLADKYQQRAISEINKDVYVSASAGTGKTTVLTNRFIAILREKQVPLSSIVAITFTEKAASEMKRRIFTLVNEELSLAKGKSSEYNYWKKIKRDFVYANISTIHSFCSSIIRENAYELKLDPDFDIIEEQHIKYELSKWIKRQFIKWQDEEDGANKETLALLLKEYKLSELIDILNKLFLNYHHSNSFLIPLYEEEIKNENDYCSFLTSSISKEKESTIRRFTSSITDVEYDNWQSLKNELLEHKQTKSMIEKIEALGSAISNLYRGDLSYDDFSYSLIKPIYEDTFTKPKSSLSLELKGIYKNVSDFIFLLRWRLPEYLFGIESFEEGETSKTYQIIKNLIHIYKALYKSIIEAPGLVPVLYRWLSAYLLTFDDLQTYALKLLKSNSHSSFELKSKIQYLMVDEVQDIDEIQGVIISALSSGDVNTFIVGDEKQSIYKFRGANISSFKRIGDRMGKSIDLEFSYRSDREIVDFANLIFNDLMKDVYEDFEASYKELKFGKSGSGGSATQSKIELILYDKPARQANRQTEALYIANRIIHLVEEDKRQYGEIAILFRAFTEIEIYETVFREKGIPYSILKSRGFYEHKEIVDALSFLKYIDNPSDEISLCAILRSPFCGISDETLFWLSYDEKSGNQSLTKGFYGFHKNDNILEEERIKLSFFLDLMNRLIGKKDRVRADELLRSAIDESLYIPCIIAKERGVEIKNNLEIFARRVKGIQDMSNTYSLPELLDFIENIDKYGETSGNVEKLSGENKIIIMSIHKSKGMEFPIVIIPDSGKRQSNKESIALDKEYGIALKYLPNGADKEYKLVRSSLLNYLVERDKRKDIAESKRLLYVAITRAREHLIILGGASSLPKSPFDLRDNVTWMDYILWVLFNHNDVFSQWMAENIGLRGSLDKSFFVSGSRIRLLYNCIKEAGVLPKSDISLREEPLININDDVLFSLDKVSASSLLVYTKCLRKFYYKFILQIEESEEGIGPYKRSDISDELKEREALLSKDIPLNLVGSLVHKILEGYEESQPVLDIVLNYLKLERLSVLSDEGSLEELRLRIKDILNIFVNSSLYDDIKWGMENSAEYDHNELSFSHLIDDILLEGSIDKIYKNKDGQISILDYKTNRFNKSANIERQVRSKNALYKIQMDIYWLIAQLLFPKGEGEEGNIFKSSLYYFDIDRIEDILCSDPSSFADNIKKNILSVINEVKANLSSSAPPLEVFHTRNASKQDCLFCGYFMCENK